MPAIPTVAAAVSNQGPIKVPDASTKGGQYRIAGRRLVTTFLNSVLVLDTQISCFDLHMFSGKYALCTGKLVHIYSIARGAITATLGNTVGHRSEIRSCGFNATGSLLITGGEDGRIVIWNLAKQRTERIINAHKGNVYMVRFTSDDMQFLSCGDDGRIVLWECGPNNATYSTNFQHPSPVRSFAFCDMHGSRMLSARADGVVDAWDTTAIRILDSILPESDWQERELLSQLGNSGHALAILAMLQAKDTKAAQANRDREHHAGSVLHVTLSPNTRYLATCSTDKTCKLWDIATYMKEEKDVQENPNVPDQTHPINVWDESVGPKAVDGELHVGNVDIKLGYHADLLFTLQHEDPVVCAVFTALSDMVITSSLDCTVRFWSVRRGNLLFQINTPSPVHQLIVDGDNTLYAICGIRLMIFKFRAAKEKDALAELEEQRLQSLQEAQKAREAQVTDPSQRFKALMNQDGSGAEGEDPEGPERFTIGEVRSLLAQGSLLASSLETLLSENQSINQSQLRLNMALHNVRPGALLKAIVQNDFHPGDILAAFASADLVNGRSGCAVGDLFGLLKTGDPLNTFLLRAGLRPMSRAANPVFPLHFKDFRPFRSLENETPDRSRMLHPISLSGLGGSDSSSDDETEDAEGRAFGGVQFALGGTRVESVAKKKATPTGQVLHYIPSETVTMERMATATVGSTPERPRLRKLYLEPSSTRPPTTPLRFTQIESRGDQLFMLGGQTTGAIHNPGGFGGMVAGAGGGVPGIARAQQQQQAPASPVPTNWTSNGPQRAAYVPPPYLQRVMAASGQGQQGTLYRGRQYQSAFRDANSSSFLHPSPDGNLRGRSLTRDMAEPAPKPKRGERRSTSLPPPPPVNFAPDGTPLTVRHLMSKVPEDAEIEDYDEDAFDYSLIDKAADAYKHAAAKKKKRRARQRSRGGARRRSRSNSQSSRRPPSPLVAYAGLSLFIGHEAESMDALNQEPLGLPPPGPIVSKRQALKVGHIYAQPVVLEHDVGADLTTALQVGRPVQVRSTRARPTFTN